MPLDLSKLVQVDKTDPATALQVHVVEQHMAVGSLGLQQVVLEALMPSPSQKRACLEQDHVDQHQDLVAFLGDVHAASQASQKDSSWERRLACSGPV